MNHSGVNIMNDYLKTNQFSELIDNLQQLEIGINDFHLPKITLTDCSTSDFETIKYSSETRTLEIPNGNIYHSEARPPSTEI